MTAPEVLVLSPHLAPPPGGVQRLAMNVADALDDRAVRVVGVSEAQPNDPRVRAVIQRPGRVGAALATLRYTAIALREVRRRPVVVQAMTWRAALPAVLTPRRRTPVVLFCMGGELVRSSGRFEERLRRFTLRRADRIIAISGFTASLVRDVSGCEPVLIHPPVGAIPTEVAPRATRETVKVVSVGRLVPNKGHDRLLRAVADARRNGADLDVTIAGSGPEEAALRALIDELQLGDAARLIGAVDDAALDALYRDADIFALLSTPVAGEVEGFGIVFLEANAYNLPVIAGRSGGSTDAVADGVSGIVVDDHASTVAALQRLAADAALRAQMGAAGRERLADFTLAHFGDRLRLLYAGLIA